MNLHVVPDSESDPMSLSELKAHGDQLLGRAKLAAGDAMVASVKPEFLLRGGGYRIADIKRIQATARAAVIAWNQVDSILSDLVDEFDRANRAAKQ